MVDLDRPDRRRTFAVVPDRDEVTGLRFVPGSRLAVVMASAPPSLVRGARRHGYGPYRPQAGLRPGNDSIGTSGPGMSADGRLLATPQERGRR